MTKPGRIKIFKKIFIAAALVVVFIASITAEVINTDMLKSPGVRAIGMAGAFTAVADDYSSFFWNPAGLTALTRMSGSMNFDSVYKGMQNDIGLSFAAPLQDNLNLALSYIHTDFNNSIFSDDEFFISSGTFLDDSKEASVGLTLKFLNISGKDYINGGTASLDAGLIYQPESLDKKVRFGAILQDIDTSIHWSNGISESVPYMVRLGGEYIFDKTMIAAADLDMTTGGVQRESGMGMHLGAEKWVNADAAGNFGFRAGFALDSEYSPAYSLTFGVSYAREDFDVDYAFIPDFRSLGETHKINLTYFFGEQVKTGEKKKTAVEQLKTVTAVAETPTAQVVRPELLSGAVMEVSSRYVSPGKNTIKFMITDASYDPGDLDINLDIIDAKNKTVCTLSAFGKIPGYIEWNGSIDGKIWANDGDYTAKMSIKENNSLLWEKTRVVTVDQTPPVSEITVEPKIFAANPASTVKEMAIIVKSRYSDIKSWQLAVKDEQSNVVKRLTGEGFAAKIMWNGKDALGNYVKDGKYVVAVTFEDFAGNTYDAANSVKISSELVKFSVTTDNMIFKPGKDAVKFLVKIPAGANVSGWEAEITEKDGNSVRTFRNRPTGSAGVTWDTANENNEAVRLGTVYKYKISVNQKSGLVSVQEGLLQSVLPEFTSTGIKLTLAAVKFDPEDKKISADQLKVLKQASDAIKQYAKDYYVFVKAYSTDYKDHEANFRLSIERAQEVAEYLTKSQGIPGEHIYIIGYGDGEYADSSIKDSIVSKGNRAEVELLAK